MHWHQSSTSDSVGKLTEKFLEAGLPRKTVHLLLGQEMRKKLVDAQPGKGTERSPKGPHTLPERDGVLPMSVARTHRECSHMDCKLVRFCSVRHDETPADVSREGSKVRMCT